MLYLKRHIIDIVGIVLTVSLFFIEGLATALGFLAILAYLYLNVGFFVIFPILLAVNIAAYIMVKKNNEAGVIPAFFGGIIGGALAVYLENREYIGKAFIKAVFKIFIWICILAVTSYLLIDSGYYDFQLFGMIE